MEAFDFSVPNDLLVGFFVDAENELSRLIANRADDFGRLRLAEIQANVNTIMNTLRSQSTQWSGSILPALYQKSIDETIEDLLNLGLTTRNIDISFTRVNIATVEALVANTNGDLLRAINEGERNIMRQLRQVQTKAISEAAINKELGLSVVAGESAKSAANRLAEVIANPIVTVSSGRKFKTSHYSRLVAVTRTREAATQGVKNTMVDQGQDLVQVSSHPHKKDLCTPYDGKVFSLSGNSPKYPFIDSIPNDGPPFHPFCRHVLLPFVEALAEPEEIQEGSGIDDKFLNPNLKPSQVDSLAKKDNNLDTVTSGRQPSI